MKRLISAIVISALCVQLIGCTSSRNITREEFAIIKKGDMQIVTKENKSFELVEDQYSVKNDTIFLINGPIYFNPYEDQFIPMDDIDEYEAKEFDLAETVLFVVSASIIAVAFFFGIFALSY